MKQKLIFTNLVGTAIDTLVEELGNPHVVAVIDVNTAQYVLPLLKNDSKAIAGADLITIKCGDANKSLEQLTDVWKQLSQIEATRSSLVILIGGGVVNDLGGFAAATFKRGLRTINVPTTLLAAVDASYGGKTAINFQGIKNQIGAFTEPEAAVVSTVFFNTLPMQQILSGYAEMIKHGLLDTPEYFNKLLAYSPVYPTFDSQALFPLLEQSVGIKQKVVEQDPHETGLRKVLNLGHTAAHAIEALAQQRLSPVDHGYAVAWGLVIELIISNMVFQFPSDILHKLAQYVKTNYGSYDITCDDYPALLAAMRQDKKNVSPDKVNFTLLEEIGRPHINVEVEKTQIEAALDIYRDLML